MKNFVNKIIENGLQIIEILILAIFSSIPFLVNAAGLFAGYLSSTTPEPENVIAYLVVRAGNTAMAIAIFFIVLWRIRSHNKDYLMNRGNVYHQYPYWWYWFCAKILGIRRCNLVRVPIYMQFKLVIRSTFSDYPLEESAYPVVENESSVTTSVKNEEANGHYINLVLEDTYTIEEKQIPDSKQGLRTVKISRGTGDTGRHFSQKFIEAVINAVRDFDQDTVVNIFATTNPMNTKHIASRAFALADRGNVKNLYVFQQNNSDGRKFETKTHKIF